MVCCLPPKNFVRRKPKNITKNVAGNNEFDDLKLKEDEIFRYDTACGSINQATFTDRDPGTILFQVQCIF